MGDEDSNTEETCWLQYDIGQNVSAFHFPAPVGFECDVCHAPAVADDFEVKIMRKDGCDFIEIGYDTELCLASPVYDKTTGRCTSWMTEGRSTESDECSEESTTEEFSGSNLQDSYFSPVPPEFTQQRKRSGKMEFRAETKTDLVDGPFDITANYSTFPKIEDFGGPFTWTAGVSGNSVAYYNKVDGTNQTANALDYYTRLEDWKKSNYPPKKSSTTEEWWVLENTEHTWVDYDSTTGSCKKKTYKDKYLAPDWHIAVASQGAEEYKIGHEIDHTWEDLGAGYTDELPAKPDRHTQKWKVVEKIVVYPRRMWIFESYNPDPDTLGRVTLDPNKFLIMDKDTGKPILASDE